MTASSFCIVFITVPRGPVAKKITDSLLKKRLVACVNILPAIMSIYRWKGKICRDQESLLIIKTRRSHLPKLEKLVRTIHPYTVPEIIAVPLNFGHKPYLSWIHAETK